MCSSDLCGFPHAGSSLCPRCVQGEWASGCGWPEFRAGAIHAAAHSWKSAVRLGFGGLRPVVPPGFALVPCVTWGPLLQPSEVQVRSRAHGCCPPRGSVHTSPSLGFRPGLSLSPFTGRGPARACDILFGCQTLSSKSPLAPQEEKALRVHSFPSPLRGPGPACRSLLGLRVQAGLSSLSTSCSIRPRHGW